jgi:ATP-binding cassette subfamily B protein
MRFNNEEMGRFSTASLITRTTNDITQMQTIIAMGLQIIIKAPILMVWPS